MNRLFQSSKTLIFLFSILLLLGLVVSYTSLILPKMKEKELLSTQITNLQIDTKLLEKQIEQINQSETEVQTDKELRQKLPADRELDELLRTLKKFERTSNVHIQEISFLQYDSSFNDSTNAEETTNSFTDDLLSAIGMQNKEEDPEAEQIQFPDQLKFITFKVEIEVKEIQQLLKFLTEIENEQRFIRIEQVVFSNPQLENTEDVVQPILTTLHLTTYYFTDEAN